ncbi:Clathrin light chain A [Holothuria leucospilota]|uniref:Clathrin light chain n=1 Tax=Holothuria leucospilota TaxID=206669 RepID=A0A9Q1BC99_HOLLE|nr:Clathrin light chain A [Holothuria leucospilota]
MADFGEFENENAPAAAEEVDPAAEFLAREQDQLAGLEDDNLGGGISQTVTDGDFGGGEVTQGDLVDEFGGTGDILGGDAPQTNGPSDAYSAISQIDRTENEPEKIKKWREEQAEMLAKKDEESKKLQEEWAVQAKKELDDWYNREAEQLTKSKAGNRAAEEAFIKERDEITPGQEWERIARLCDFNPKNNKNTKDVTRLRSILLHLKQSGLQRS